MPKHFSLCLICLLLLLTACGQKKAKVSETRLVLGAIAGVNFTDGGVLLTGSGPTGSFAKNISSGAVSYSLKTGTWNFRVVAWSGPGVMQGALRCASASANLSQPDETVALNLSEAGCSNAVFGGTQMRDMATGSFPPIKVHTCMDFTRDISANGYVVPEDMVDCDMDAGKERSFKIVVQQIDIPATAGTPSAPLVSDCITGMTAGVASITTTLRMPDLGVPVKIEGYSQAGCTGDLRLFDFNFGIRGFSFLNDGMARSRNSITNIFLDSNWCAGSSLLATPFASGAFNPTARNIICTPEHLAALAPGSPTFLATHVDPGSDFVLGADIDLSGSWTVSSYQIGGPLGGGNEFSASLDGNGHIIHSGNNSLFKTIGSGAYVGDFTLSNIHLTAAGNANVSTKGILADQITGATGIVLRGIDVINSSITPGVTFDTFGVIGKILDAEVFMEGINIDSVDILGNVADATQLYLGILAGENATSTGTLNQKFETITITNSSVEGYDFVGGLIGRSNLQASTGGMASIREIFIGDSTVIGRTNVGGVIGSHDAFTSTPTRLFLSDVQYDSSNDLLYYVQGDATIGGILGQGLKEVSITKANFTGKIFALATATMDVGGIVGNLAQGSIENSSTINNIEIDAAVSTVSHIGGVAGNIGVAATSGVKVQNVSSYSFINVLCPTCSATQVGGAIGMSNGSPGPSMSSYNQSLASGDIIFTDETLASSVGGMIGSASETNVLQSISHVNLGGADLVGGAIGTYLGTGSLDQFYVDGNMSWSGAPTGGLGGLVGEANNTTMISQGLYLGTITESVLCGSTAITFCGTLIGRSMGPSVTCANLSTDTGYAVSGTITKAIGTTSTTCSITATEDTNAKANFAGSSGIDATSPHDLFFITDWMYYSPTLTSGGNYFEPFYLTTPTDWNQLASSEFLLSKSYVLGNDIVFAGNFTPLGGNSASPLIYSGSISSNGFHLQNIVINPADCGSSNHCGVVRKLGSFTLVKFGEFGSMDDPIVIDGLTLNGNGSMINIGGAVGLAEMGMVSVQISNGAINGTSGTGPVGGVVAKVDTGSSTVSISNSSFSGTINLTSGYSEVGGIVGLAQGASGGRVEIRNSFSDVSFVGTSGHKGGIVGGIMLNGAAPLPDLTINGVYSVINAFGGTTGYNGGLIGRYNLVAGGTFDMQNAIAVINTADTAKGILGEFVTSSGVLTGFTNNISNIILVGDQVAHPLVPFGDPTTLGTSTSSWSSFLGSVAPSFPMDNELYFGDINYQHPRFYWQYPVGTFPFHY